MNVTRSRVALVSNMGRLWAIGGYDGMKNLSTVEVYNPETNTWYQFFKNFFFFVTDDKAKKARAFHQGIIKGEVSLYHRPLV
jgi:hypothetical protein